MAHFTLAKISVVGKMPDFALLSLAVKVVKQFLTLPFQQ
jgi:hypothetical protein